MQVTCWLEDLKTLLSPTFVLGHIVTMTLLNPPKMALRIITPTEGKKTGVMGSSWPSFHKAAWALQTPVY